jgi:hypothetical protein
MHRLFKDFGIDHNMGRKPCAKAQRLISRNAPASGLAQLMIDARIFACRFFQQVVAALLSFLERLL